MNHIFLVEALGLSVEEVHNRVLMDTAVREQLGEILMRLFKLFVEGCTYEIQDTQMVCLAQYSHAPGYYLMAQVVEVAGVTASVPWSVVLHQPAVAFAERFMRDPEPILKELKSDPQLQAMIHMLKLSEAGSEGAN